MKVAAVVGARPQFIKAAPVSRALREAGHDEVLIHTGQHYDDRMSKVFFDELAIPAPAVNLGIGSGSHGRQTGRMLEAIERLLLQARPDCVIVYGDTNSTVAGALATCKLGIPLAHVEAGLRSYNRTMPEEHNRVLTDHCADRLFCPTRTAVENLAREGITAGVHLVGDTMYDAVLQFADVAAARSTILETLGLAPRTYLLATVHRAYNADDPANLRAILEGFAATEAPVVFPVHPRTRGRIAALGGNAGGAANVRMLEPLGYFDMLVLERNARMILTDSGGMQKEAYFFGVPCVTLRPETEWVETVAAGRNVLVGADAGRIRRAVYETAWPTGAPEPIFGTGQAARAIVERLG